MAKKELHPSVQEFKQFVKRHPKIIKEVREGKATWQELFEEWYLLGEDDPRFLPYKENNGNQTEDAGKKAGKDTNQTTFFNNLLQTFRNMDMNQLQSYIGQLHDALGAARNFLSQFQEEQHAGGRNRDDSERRPNPFSFRKD